MATGLTGERALSMNLVNNRFAMTAHILGLLLVLLLLSADKRNGCTAMGNTVSAAEKVASNIVPSTLTKGEEATLPKGHPPVGDKSAMGGNPPPECPMHQKQQPKEQPVLVSECP
uniref:Uncharacterized protein n=1 Tax=Anopheles maculatus TaxID=74869 RepID=A0A182SI28_9DIPT